MVILGFGVESNLFSSDQIERIITNLDTHRKFSYEILMEIKGREINIVPFFHTDLPVVIYQVVRLRNNIEDVCLGYPLLR